MTQNNDYSNVIELRPVQSAKFNGLAIAVGGFADGIPRVQDLDLATWLELPVAEVRALIRRSVERRFIRKSDLRTTVSQDTKRRTTEYWLTEEQALFIAARSDSPRSFQLLSEMISVGHRRGVRE